MGTNDPHLGMAIPRKISHLGESRNGNLRDLSGQNNFLLLQFMTNKLLVLTSLWTNVLSAFCPRSIHQIKPLKNHELSLGIVLQCAMRAHAPSHCPSMILVCHHFSRLCKGNTPTEESFYVHTTFATFTQ